MASSSFPTPAPPVSGPAAPALPTPPTSAVAVAADLLGLALADLKQLSSTLRDVFRPLYVEAVKSRDPKNIAFAKAEVAQAEAEVAHAEAKVAHAMAEVAHAEAKVAQAKAEVVQADAKAVLERLQISGAAAADVALAKAEVAQAEAKIVHAEAKIAHAETKVSDAEAKVSHAEAKVAQAKAEVAQAKAEVAQADAKAVLERLQISGAAAADMASALADVRRAAAVVEVARLQVVYERLSATKAAPSDLLAAQVAVREGEIRLASGFFNIPPNKVSIFQDDTNATAFVTELMRAVPVELTAGVSQMNLGCDPLFANQIVNIFLRPDTMPYWTKVKASLLEHVERKQKRNNVIAVGSPGIGKSATIPCLIRLLLEDGKTVVFQLHRTPTSSEFFLFRATAPGVFQGQRCTASRLSDIVELQKTSGIVLVIEPSELRIPPSLFEFNCPFVLVCSPNRTHYGGIGKGDDHGDASFLFYSTWTLEELQAVREQILVEGRHLTSEEVDTRYFVFGGCARYVFASQQKYTDALTAQRGGVHKVTSKVAIDLLFLGSNQQISDEVNESAGYTSSVVCYKTTAPYDVAHRQTIFVSDHVRICVWYCNLSSLWARFSNAATYAEAGYAFERYCYNILCTQNTFEVQRIAGSCDPCLTEVSTVSRRRSEVTSPESSAYRSTSSDLFSPVLSNYRFIDAADRDADGLRAFQCTVSSSHSCNALRVDEMLADFGVPTAVLRVVTRKVVASLVQSNVLENALETASAVDTPTFEETVYLQLNRTALAASRDRFPLLESPLHDELVLVAKEVAEAVARAVAVELAKNRNLLRNGNSAKALSSVATEAAHGVIALRTFSEVPIVRLFFMVPSAISFRLAADDIKKLPHEVDLYLLSVQQPSAGLSSLLPESSPGPDECSMWWQRKGSASKRPRQE